MSDENISGGAENASDPGADIKSTALGQMAKAESIENYAAERADQEAEAEGREPSTPPEERVNRYQQVLEQARQETDRARRENGLGGEQNGFDAQVEQAALAQEQDRAYEEEITRREKQAADVALYTTKQTRNLISTPTSGIASRQPSRLFRPQRKSRSNSLNVRTAPKSYGG